MKNGKEIRRSRCPLVEIGGLLGERVSRKRENA